MLEILSICVALISLITTCIVAGVYIGKIEGFKEFVNYRFDKQDEKLEKHNNFIERLYTVERKINVDEEKIEVANHRIEDLEELQKCINANGLKHTNL